MELKGKIHELGATTQITESLKKREVIIEYIENPQYPEYLKFDAINDRCALLDKFKVGDDVEIYFNLRGRPHTFKDGKKSYFNSMALWKVVKLSGTPEYAAPANYSSAPGDDDDLPF